MVVGYVSPKIAPETAECGVERFQETWMSCEVKPQTAKLAAAIDFFLSNSRCSGSQMPEQRLRSSYSGKARRLYVVLFPDLDSSTNPDSSTDFSSLVEPNLGLSRTKNTAVRRFGNIGKRSRRV